MADLPSDPRRIVVVGASAGGVEALTTIAAGLPRDLGAGVFVAVHITPWARSTLPSILNRAGPLPAAQASDAEPIREQRIYVAPPDRHLLISKDRVRVTRGPRENGSRPAIDALFRSAADTHGPAVVGVILTGTLDDGAAGIRSIKDAGGMAIVQSDAPFPDMPRNAIEAAAVDHVVPVAEIADLICVAVAGSLPQVPQLHPRVEHIADAPFQATPISGPAIEITCPACGGVLTEAADDPPQFRCRVGHAYGGESLLAHQSDALEQSLWAALRALEERTQLLDRIATRFANRGSVHQAERFQEDSDVARRRAAIVRRALLDRDLVAGEGPLASSEEADVAGEPLDGELNAAQGA